jgi:alkanesulfonate monooxygenase SsuD/methylene tetrahydromethanopterin reductase-like flavin-dependent oxidoreductase (luciferase family)
LPDGPGKPLRLSVHPVRERIPVYLAAVGPKNLELAGEIADGWLAIFFSPEYAESPLGRVRAGAERVGRDLTEIDVVATVPVVVGDDAAACADRLRGYAALYIGGMGSRRQNFYNALAVRMGYEAAAAQVQELFLARRTRDAMAAVPFEFIDQTSLIGPRQRIVERLQAFAAAGVTTLSVSCPSGGLSENTATLRVVAEALDAAGVGD